MASEWLYSDATRLEVHDVCKWIHSNGSAHEHLILRTWRDHSGYEYRDVPPTPDKPIHFENFIFRFEHHSPKYLVSDFSDLDEAEDYICGETGALSPYSGFIVVFWKRRVLPYRLTYLNVDGKPCDLTIHDIGLGVARKKWI